MLTNILNQGFPLDKKEISCLTKLTYTSSEKNDKALAVLILAALKVWKM